MMYYNQLETGRRIQKLRRERYLTQEELAIKLNISDRHLRNLERGEYQALCKQADDEIARLEKELQALTPAPETQSVSTNMKAIRDFLEQKVDVHGACLAPELIDQFVEVVTPIGDYTYRWKLNTGRKKSKDERTDLMAVTDSPILAFTIDFETAKRYREANKMPHQFRRAAWTDLTVEVYL